MDAVRSFLAPLSGEVQREQEARRRFLLLKELKLAFSDIISDHCSAQQAEAWDALKIGRPGADAAALIAGVFFSAAASSISPPRDIEATDAVSSPTENADVAGPVQPVLEGRVSTPWGSGDVLQYRPSASASTATVASACGFYEVKLRWGVVYATEACVTSETAGQGGAEGNIEPVVGDGRDLESAKDDVLKEEDLSWADGEDPGAARLCAALEACLYHGLRGTAQTQVDGGPRGAALWAMLRHWEMSATPAAMASDIVDNVRTAAATQFAKTDTGRARAWLRLCLETRLLSASLEELGLFRAAGATATATATEQGGLLETFYAPNALMRCRRGSLLFRALVCTLALPRFPVRFRLDCDHPFLDNLKQATAAGSSPRRPRVSSSGGMDEVGAWLSGASDAVLGADSRTQMLRQARELRSAASSNASQLFKHAGALADRVAVSARNLKSSMGQAGHMRTMQWGTTEDDAKAAATSAALDSGVSESADGSRADDFNARWGGGGGMVAQPTPQGQPAEVTAPAPAPALSFRERLRSASGSLKAAAGAVTSGAAAAAQSAAAAVADAREKQRRQQQLQSDTHSNSSMHGIQVEPPSQTQAQLQSQVEVKLDRVPEPAWSDTSRLSRANSANDNDDHIPAAPEARSRTEIEIADDDI